MGNRISAGDNINSKNNDASNPKSNSIMRTDEDDKNMEGDCAEKNSNSDNNNNYKSDMDADATNSKGLLAAEDSSNDKSKAPLRECNTLDEGAATAARSTINNNSISATQGSTCTTCFTQLTAGMQGINVPIFVGDDDQSENSESDQSDSFVPPSSTNTYHCSESIEQPNVQHPASYPPNVLDPANAMPKAPASRQAARSVQTLPLNTTALKLISASEICKGLWLGDINDALDFPSLQNKRISHILNVAADCPPADLQRQSESGLVVAHLRLKDKSDEPIERYFRDCFKFIKEGTIHPNSALYQVGNANTDVPVTGVLVHCLKGVSRSPTIVIAYLSTYGIPDEEKIDLARNDEGCISNEDAITWRRELMKFESSDCNYCNDVSPLLNHSYHEHKNSGPPGTCFTDVNDVRSFVVHKRNIVNPNLGFCMVLRRLNMIRGFKPNANEVRGLNLLDNNISFYYYGCEGDNLQDDRYKDRRTVSVAPPTNSFSGLYQAGCSEASIPFRAACSANHYSPFRAGFTPASCVGFPFVITGDSMLLENLKPHISIEEYEEMQHSLSPSKRQVPIHEKPDYINSFVDKHCIDNLQPNNNNRLDPFIIRTVLEHKPTECNNESSTRVSRETSVVNGSDMASTTLEAPYNAQRNTEDTANKKANRQPPTATQSMTNQAPGEQRNQSIAPSGSAPIALYHQGAQVQRKGLTQAPSQNINPKNVNQIKSTSKLRGAKRPTPQLRVPTNPTPE